VTDPSPLPETPATDARAGRLVVGVGSELRRDDAAGRRVADAIAARRMDDVEVRSVHQLTPELALDIDDRRLVVFVDASVDVTELTVREIVDDVAGPAGSHHVGPPALLALAARLGHAPDRVMVVHVPVTDLGLGLELSPAASREVARAVETVIELLHPSRWCAGAGGAG
jgi:hydrogenase maturation protease